MEEKQAELNNLKKKLDPIKNNITEITKKISTIQKKISEKKMEIKLLNFKLKQEKDSDQKTLLSQELAVLQEALNSNNETRTKLLEEKTQEFGKEREIKDQQKEIRQSMGILKPNIKKEPDEE